MDEFAKKINISSGASAPAVDDAADDPFADIKKEIRTRFELLPPDLQKTITDSEYQNALFEIAKAQKLTYEELGILEMDTTMVLLGMVKPEDFRDDLQRDLRKNDSELDSVVAAVNDRVFAPIKSSLERVYAVKSEPEDFLSRDIQGNPLPSAAVPATSLTPAEKTVLEKTGVVISETPAPTPIVRSPLPERTDILRGIENPPRGASSGILESKLTSAAPLMPKKTTDYSIQKPAPESQPPKKSDPYRESVE